MFVYLFSGQCSCQHVAVTVLNQSRTPSSAAVNILFVLAPAAAMWGKCMWSRVYLSKRVYYPAYPLNNILMYSVFFYSIAGRYSAC